MRRLQVIAIALGILVLIGATFALSGCGHRASTPPSTPAPTVWAAVSCGEDNTVALARDGSLWAWGWNLRGQLGLGAIGEAHVLTRVGSAHDWAALDCGGDDDVFALKKDSSLWVWGWNSDGELGLGDTVERRTPTELGSGHDWATVSSNGLDTLALKKDGSLWAWGLNHSGALGLGDTRSRLVPTRVGRAHDWVAIASGDSSFALKKDGSLWAWGWNRDGELGLGDTRERHVPTRLGHAHDWAAVACEWGPCLALKKDGSLWSWDLNMDSGIVPTRVGNAHDWASVVGGTDVSLALKKDGSLWAWGWNRDGELGLGDTR